MGWAQDLNRLPGREPVHRAKPDEASPLRIECFA
jgi:hypothetical protein